MRGGGTPSSAKCPTQTAPPPSAPGLCSSGSRGSLLLRTRGSRLRDGPGFLGSPHLVVPGPSGRLWLPDQPVAPEERKHCCPARSLSPSRSPRTPARHTSPHARALRGSAPLLSWRRACPAVGGAGGGRRRPQPLSPPRPGAGLAVAPACSEAVRAGVSAPGNRSSSRCARDIGSFQAPFPRQHALFPLYPQLSRPQEGSCLPSPSATPAGSAGERGQCGTSRWHG